MDKISIIGLGSYSPENQIDNQAISQWVDTTDEWIRERTGIRSRRLTKGEDTSQLAIHAAKKALTDGGVDAKKLGLILLSTATPDQFTPSTACMVQKEIGADNAICFDISAACSGFVYGLDIAEKYMRTSDIDYALVIGAETLSKITDWSDRNTCVLFGDGAGAVVLAKGKEQGIVASYLGSKGDEKDSLYIPAVPVSNPLGGTRKDPQLLQMNGREVFKFAVGIIPRSVEKVLAKSGMTLEEVDYIIPHQANERIVTAVADKMKLPLEKFFVNLHELGNTSSASIPLAMAEMKAKGLLKNGMKLVLVGFGGGFTWGATLIHWTQEDNIS